MDPETLPLPSGAPPSAPARLVLCDEATHAEAILAIFNDAIVNGTALYDYRERTMDDMHRWFRAKAEGGWPVLGLVGPVTPERPAGLLGFASFGPFRAFAAYKYTAEHAIYVHRSARGGGLGQRLLTELIAAARARELHTLIGAIDASNTASLALHRRLGFVHAGTLRQVGYKFGRWLDLDLMQLVLETPAAPHDGLP